MRDHFFRKMRPLNLILCLVLCLNSGFSGNVLAMERTDATSMLRPQAASGRVESIVLDMGIEELNRILQSKGRQALERQLGEMAISRVQDPFEKQLIEDNIAVVEKDGRFYIVCLIGNGWYMELAAQGELKPVAFASEEEKLAFMADKQRTWLSGMGHATPRQIYEAQTAADGYIRQAGEEGRIFVESELEAQVREYARKKGLSAQAQAALLARLKAAIAFRNNAIQSLTQDDINAFLGGQRAPLPMNVERVKRALLDDPTIRKVIIFDEDGKVAFALMGDPLTQEYLAVTASSGTGFLFPGYKGNIARSIYEILGMTESYMAMIKAGDQDAVRAYKAKLLHEYIMVNSRSRGLRREIQPIRDLVSGYDHIAITRWLEREAEKERVRLLQVEDKKTVAEAFRVNIDSLLTGPVSGAILEALMDASGAGLQGLVENGLFTDFRVYYDNGNLYFFTTRSNKKAIEDSLRVLPAIVNVYLQVLAKARTLNIYRGEDLAGKPYAQQIDSLNIEVAPTLTSLELQDWARLVFMPIRASLGGYAGLDSVHVAGKTVLVRPDINVPAAGGHIIDIEHPHARVLAAAETIRELAEHNAKVVVIFHQGRPGEPDFMDTPFEHAQQISGIIGRAVKAVDDLFGPQAIAAIHALKPGEILFLKPVRAADPSTGKILEENPYFTAVLKELIDLFVLDGFSVAHRDSNSVTGFQGVPTVAGRLMQREIEGASKLLNPPQPRVVAVGGGKLSDKFPGFRGELESGKANRVFVGGRLANLALVAAQPGAAQAQSEEAQYQLALSTLGKPTADELRQEGLNLLPQLVELLARYGDRIVLPVDMVYLDAAEVRHVVELIAGRVPAGFAYLLKGIGPKTAALYVDVVKQVKPQSGHIMGPLSDSRYDVFLEETRELLEVFAQEVPFWSSGGGDTDAVISKLGFQPTYTSLAGSALGEFLAGKALPGVETLKNNQPDKLKPFVPATAADAYALAHTTVLGSIARAFQRAGSTVSVRTHLFIEGGRVDGASFISAPMSAAVRQAIRKSLGERVAEALAGLETILINAVNPYVNFSISNLYTLDNRPINPALLRRALADNDDVALILVPGELDKKGRMGPAGDIDTKKLTATLRKILYQALRERGINPEAMRSVVARPLPAIAQITRSNIDSQLKLVVVVPTPGSEIYRLMQLAQDAGINLKALLEDKLPVAKDTTEALKEAQMAQAPLLGEQPALAQLQAAAEKAESGEVSPLAGLKLGNAEINTALQTIFYADSQVPAEEILRQDLEDILRRVREAQKVVRIAVLHNSRMVKVVYSMLEELGSENLNIASHFMVHDGLEFEAFVIRPKKNTILVGYGNEAVKVAPLLKAAGFGIPTVAIHSLARPERVVHAFEMGYYVVLTDLSRDKAGSVVRPYADPGQLEAAKEQIKKLLIEAYAARARNKLLRNLPDSERRAQEAEIIRQARSIGEEMAEYVFNRQFKGLLSPLLMAGEYDLIIDCTPEGTGAVNKELLYQPAIQANPGKKIVVLYQGGEKAKVADTSFSTISADFDQVLDLTHVRHVSCNTTALSTMVLALLKQLGIAIDLDNTAFRRGPDPGDTKDGAAGISVSSNYHHFPDVETVTPEELGEFLRGNTDAAQIGSNTRFHIHMLYLRRRDGKRLDKKAVQRILALQPRVAVIDFPGDVFDSIRLTEMAHNLLPQVIRWAPDGANHLLVPVVTVQETDDPAQLRLIYAVPQESIVAPGNINAADALFGHSTRDASLAMVDDLSGLAQIVSDIETRLPVKGLEVAEEVISGEQAEAAVLVTPAQITPVITPPRTQPAPLAAIQEFIRDWTKAVEGDGFYRSLLALQNAGVVIQLNDDVFAAARDVARQKVILISSRGLRSDPSLIFALQSINQQINQRLGVPGSANIAANAYKFVLVVDDTEIQTQTELDELFAEIARITHNQANKDMFDMILTQGDMSEGSISDAAALLAELKIRGIQEESVVGLVGFKEWTSGLKIQPAIANAISVNIDARDGEIAFAGTGLFAVVEAVATPNRQVPAYVARRLELIQEATTIDVIPKPIDEKVTDEIEAYRRQVEARVRV